MAPWRGCTMHGRRAGLGYFVGTTLYTDDFSRFPTQEGSIGWENKTYRTLGQSRKAGGMAFVSMFPKCEAACGGRPRLAKGEKGFVFPPHRSLLSGEKLVKGTQLAKLNTTRMAAGDFSRLHM